MPLDKIDLLAVVAPRAAELFETWQDLKVNTAGRLLCWLRDGRPATYPMLDDFISMAEAAAGFRKAAMDLGDYDVELLLGQAEPTWQRARGGR